MQIQLGIMQKAQPIERVTMSSFSTTHLLIIAQGYGEANKKSGGWREKVDPSFLSKKNVGRNIVKSTKGWMRTISTIASY